MIYFCCDERRRALVRDPAVPWNGIDFIEVLDAEAPSPALRQRRLFVHFLKKLAPNALSKDQVAIAGGERIRGIRVLSATPGSGATERVLTVDVDTPGDYSTYTLRLVKDALHAGAEGEGEPPPGFDPVLSSVDFSFKVECPNDFDCRSDRVCPPEERPEVDVDYLAKDYNSFRQSMLDRLSVTVPQWQERNPADVGIALVELLAYVGDRLSYQQDVIATEAYLHTARRRVSVRRHALFVDYFMHDGCNARTWVQVGTDSDGVVLDRGAVLLTRVAGVPPVVDRNNDPPAVRRIAEAAPDTFETVEKITLYKKHGDIELYTWHQERCCLPAGATTATLKGAFPDLKPGDVLVFEEKFGPVTGNPDDADPTHRHAVRLTAVESSRDEVFNQDVTEIQWHGEDALPFAFCVSADTAAGYLENVTLVHGNIVLADHGKTITESLGEVPQPQDALATVASHAGDRCAPAAPEPVRPRFNPRLRERPLTQAAPRPASSAISASAALEWEMRDVLPAITLSDTNNAIWTPVRDLLSSDAFREDFVAEVEEDGRATLRFGDDEYGLRPTPGTTLTARYRVGNGTRGNIGAEALAHIVTGDSRITGVRNPLPARGGTEPESIEDVRRSAPSAFRTQERAVTADDYAEVAQRHREVQRAAATMRWTGSWRTVFLTVDRLGGRPVDQTFERELRIHLDRYRMAGHDVEVDGPHFVPLEIEMTVCVKPGYFRGDVRAALLAVFGNSVSAEGRRGFFHPDNFTFGQPVYLSALYAAAQRVEGVHFVVIGKFQRLGIPSSRALDEGVLEVGRLEIARLDNDPNFAERGVMRLTLEGGK